MKNERAVFGVNVERKVRRKVGGKGKRKKQNQKGRNTSFCS